MEEVMEEVVRGVGDVVRVAEVVLGLVDMLD